MNFTLVVEPAAEEDIHFAYRWYEERRIGLGVQFLEALEASFDLILENPLWKGPLPGRPGTQVSW